MIFRSLSIPLVYALLINVLVSLGAIPCGADETMDRIGATGILRVGFREDTIPFAYFDEKAGKHVGFSVDMAELLVRNLSKRFERNIAIKPISVTSKSRIPMIVGGAVDVEMGASTYTKEREELVDFSLIFFVSETTLMSRAGSGIQNLTDLDGKRVGCTAGTTNLWAVRRYVAAERFKPKAIVVTDTHAEGIRSLEKGLIDAYASDRIILNVIRMKDPNPERWHTADFAIGSETYAYMVREANSDFRDFLNNTIRWAILSGEFDEIYDKWLGPKGVSPYKMPPTFKEYLNTIVYHMEEDWWKE